MTEQDRYRESGSSLDDIDKSTYQRLLENFIRETQDKIDWETVGFNITNFSSSFIHEFAKKIEWDLILEYKDLPKDFIIKFADDININSNISFALTFQKSLKGYTKEELLKEIEEYKMKQMEQRTEELIDKETNQNISNLQENQSIDDFTRQQSLEDSIRKFQSYIDWETVGANITDFSSSFIHDFAKKIEWDLVLEYKDLPKDFIIKFADDININANINFALTFQKSLKGYTKEDLLNEIEEYKMKQIEETIAKQVEELIDQELDQIINNIQEEQLIDDFSEEIDEEIEK